MPQIARPSEGWWGDTRLRQAYVAAPLGMTQVPKQGRAEACEGGSPANANHIPERRSLMIDLRRSFRRWSATPKAVRVIAAAQRSSK